MSLYTPQSTTETKQSIIKLESNIIKQNFFTDEKYNKLGRTFYYNVDSNFIKETIFVV